MTWLRRILSRRRDAARLLDVIVNGWTRPGMVRRPCCTCGRPHWNLGEVSFPMCPPCFDDFMGGEA